jgi:hypothetical protein
MHFWKRLFGKREKLAGATSTEWRSLKNESDELNKILQERGVLEGEDLERLKQLTETLERMTKRLDSK